MIILDTNVVSESMRPRPDAAVLIWLESVRNVRLYFTAISYSEMLIGVDWLPDGQRKQRLSEAIGRFINGYFGDRILPFDARAAAASPGIVNGSRRSGFNIVHADAQIASIAIAHGFAVATRDTSPFEAAGVPVINPWAAEG